MVVRMPARWNGNRPPRPQVTATVGGKPPSRARAWTRCSTSSMEVTLDGETADRRPRSSGCWPARTGWRFCAAGGSRWTASGSAGMLEQFRGDRAPWPPTGPVLRRGDAAARRCRTAVADAATAGRRRTGARSSPGRGWPRRWRAARPGWARARRPGPSRCGPRCAPTSRSACAGCYLLAQLGLGACLADDMGLGKTIQVLALLLVLRRRSPGGPRRPSLLVAPASLLANWAAEIARFAPGLRRSWPIRRPCRRRAEGARRARWPASIWSSPATARCCALPWLAATPLAPRRPRRGAGDQEPGAKQTRAVEALKAGARIALTGTPIENRLGDLWSHLRFHQSRVCWARPSSSRRFVKRLADRPHNAYGPLRELVRPYILRRLKTDGASSPTCPTRPRSRPSAR